MRSNTERRPMVVFTKKTPYLVTDVDTCLDADGKPVAMMPVTALCRCGRSKHKPYCDNTHAKIGFTGEKSPDRLKDEVLDYRGREITIHDNRCICSSDGACVRGSPKVFDTDRDPWIDPNGASAREIIDTIEKCPSGALSYTYQGKRQPDQVRKPSIKIARNGPYELTGFIEIKDDLGSKPQSKEKCTLCRCGVSKNKPFCDGSHEDIGFEDAR